MGICHLAIYTRAGHFSALIAFCSRHDKRIISRQLFGLMIRNLLCRARIFLSNNTAVNTLHGQGMDVNSMLADILDDDTSFTNTILMEMQHFYHSCIVASQMDPTPTILTPVRKIYQENGQNNINTRALLLQYMV